MSFSRKTSRKKIQIQIKDKEQKYYVVWTACTFSNSMNEIEMFALQCHMFCTMSRSVNKSVKLMIWHRRLRLALFSHHKQREELGTIRIKGNLCWLTLAMKTTLSKKPRWGGVNTAVRES